MSEDNLVGEGTTPETTTTAAPATTEAVAPQSSSEAAPAVTETPDLSGSSTGFDSTDSSVTEQPHGLSDVLSEDMIAQGNLKDFKSVEDLAKSYVSAQGMLGHSVRIPTEESPPEIRQQFLDKIKDYPDVMLKPKTDAELLSIMDKLGRPETAEGYSVSVPSELISSDDYVSQKLSSFKELAHKIGLTDAQSKALQDMEMSDRAAQFEQLKTSKEEGMRTLHKQWGPDYDPRLQAAKITRDQYAEKYPEQMALLIQQNGNNPALAQMMADLALSKQEEGVIGQPRIDFGDTPTQADSKIQKLLRDKDFYAVYSNPGHAGYQAAQDEIERLAIVRASGRGE